MFNKVKKLFDFLDEDKINLENKITTKPSLFRPKTFDEYIGQKRAKKIFDNYIGAIIERKLVFPHTLIHGNPGMGKTTLAKIIANELEVSLVENIASEMKNFEKFIESVRRVNGGILFLDEIHSIGRDEVEKLYTIMEDFYFEGESIEPFTLMGATTELGEILKDRRPFYDRFKIIIELENYDLEDLTKICKQYRKMMFPFDGLHPEIYKIISKNCRGTPRTLLRLLEATIYFRGDIKEVINSFDIIKDGYTNKDLKILKYVAQEKTVGLQGLASYLNTSTENYLYCIEPYLLGENLISRTARGRRITVKGLLTIEELESEI